MRSTYKLLILLCAFMAQLGFAQTIRNYVLVEMAMGYNFKGCNGSVTSILKNQLKNSDLAIIQYHKGDFFETNDAIYRLDSMYQFSYYPQSWIDGMQVPEENFENASYFASNYNTAKNILADYKLDIVVNDNEIAVTANYLAGKKMGVRLQLAVSIKAGANQFLLSDSVYWIQTKMLPDARGTELDFTSSNEIKELFNIEDLGFSDLSKYEIIGFVQDDATKRVYQTQKARLVTTGILNTATDEIRTILFPNPTANFIKIHSPYQIKSAKIFNVLHQLLYQNEDVEDVECTISTQGLNSGVYFAEITLQDNKKDVLRFIVK